MGKAKHILGASGEVFHNRSRSAKRLGRSIAEGARRRGEEAYERLIGVARASLKQASKMRQTLRTEEAHLGGGRLADELERFEGLIDGWWISPSAGF